MTDQPIDRQNNRRTDRRAHREVSLAIISRNHYMIVQAFPDSLAGTWKTLFSNESTRLADHGIGELLKFSREKIPKKHSQRMQAPHHSVPFSKFNFKRPNGQHSVFFITKWGVFWYISEVKCGDKSKKKTGIECKHRTIRFQNIWQKT